MNTLTKIIYVKDSDETLKVAIKAAIQDSEGDFSAEFTIESSKETFPKLHYSGRGPDEILAYILAFRIIGSELFRLNQVFYKMKLAQFVDGKSDYDPYFGFLSLDSFYACDFQRKASTAP